MEAFEGKGRASAEFVFADVHITAEDTRRDYGETRFVTVGLYEGRMVVIAHTKRGDDTRIISVRKANDREQENYKERLETPRRNEG